MGQVVTGGAVLQCAFGAAPSTLVVAPANQVLNQLPVATIMDNKPMANILPFGTCISPSNPAVAAAFGAPQPCIPVTAAPWMPGSPTVLIGSFPALNNSSKCMCNWGGVIQIIFPGQVTIEVP